MPWIKSSGKCSDVSNSGVTGVQRTESAEAERFMNRILYDEEREDLWGILYSGISPQKHQARILDPR